MTDFRALPIDYERRRVDPAAWFSVGISLHVAASALWQKLRPVLSVWKSGHELSPDEDLALRLRGPFAMLSGMAIENMLKGAILEHTPAAERAACVFRTHKLVALSQKAKQQWSPEQLELLQRLTTFVVWAGRYPVATDELATHEPRILRATDYLHIVAITSTLMAVHHGKAAKP